MKEEIINERHSDATDEKIDIQELLFKYIIHWPWFVGAVLICLVGAWIYLRMATPIYNISATVLIKDDKKGGAAGMITGLENLGLDGLVSSSQNIDNEVEVLRSKTIAKEVVEQLGLYVSYTDEDEFPSKNIYKTSPVIVSLTPQEAEKLSAPMVVEMALYTQGGLDVNVAVGDNEYKKHFEKLPAVFPMNEGTLAFFQSPDSLSLKKDTIEDSSTQSVRHITATINSPMRVARAYCENLSIEPTSKTTSVAVISLKNSSLQRGQDFINQLLEMYNRNTNNDKNEIAQKTAEFIDERINIISKELGSTEANLENFKRNAGITDLSSEAQIALTGNAEYEKKRVEIRTQISLIEDLRKYIRGNEYEVLPSNVGLQDVALVATIERYNEMLVERKRLLRTSTENNPTIINLDTSIRAMKLNVQATLDGTLQGMLITKADLDREASRFSRRISDAPGQERQFVSIARQQEIKAGLYLMLLQKREENAIALAATANNAKIIDEAIADDIPVSPKRRMIYLIALVLGVGIPVGIIYLIGLTKFKLEGRADVEKLTTIPIVGDIPLTDEKNEKVGSIAVFENQNNLMSETFRNIRTNLQFMLQNDKKVILVTSTVSGEGKSFISANLAISLSLLGKKVVIVGLDIRKPGLNKVFRLSTKEKGITLYLANPETDLMSLVQPSDINQNLYILPGGTVPPNPTELLARDGLDKAIEILKKNFDYVILDTAPVGMVTDTLLIGRVADLSVYVCRADYTHKVEYTLINELAEEKKLPNLCTVINGVDLKRRKYGYYYGYGKYGKYYGYGKRYGYGYGYGQEKGAKS
jgi:tyrosine-protein kinase Etk/Wzc